MLGLSCLLKVTLVKNPRFGVVCSIHALSVASKGDAWLSVIGKLLRKIFTIFFQLRIEYFESAAS